MLQGASDSAAEYLNSLQSDLIESEKDATLSDTSEKTPFAPLEDGERYARCALERQWFRGVAALKMKAEVDMGSLKILLRHLSGASGASEKEEGEEEDEEQQQSGSEAVKNTYKADRVRGELLYSERTERNELEQEEHNCICILQLLIEEDLERIAKKEEFFQMLKLIHDVMKPKLRWRYIFAWGIMTATSTPSPWHDVDRIVCSQRHKPEYMRVPPRTCAIPIEPNPFWEQWTERTPPLALLQMRSDL